MWQPKLTTQSKLTRDASCVRTVVQNGGNGQRVTLAASGKFGGLAGKYPLAGQAQPIAADKECAACRLGQCNGIAAAAHLERQSLQPPPARGDLHRARPPTAQPCQRLTRPPETMV